MSRLWQYYLHYFEYLNESERSQENKNELISDWINNNPPNSKPGWEPYTTSLRIVNWIKYFTKVNSFNNDEWNNNLFNQISWLEKNLEKHILANHYFENIKTLLFGSYYFNGSISVKWRGFSEKELLKELDEQFLQDGGHYEKSPQYHCRMLENCLDIYNLLDNNPGNRNAKLYKKIEKVCEKALVFLRTIQYPDNTIPLFNDSAIKTSEYPNQLFKYAERLGIGKEKSNSDLISLQESGLYGFKTSDDYFLIDCGDISPSYQPGHTHCDFLSYELMLKHQKIVVDSGVFEYQKGEMRDYVRSTRAHNTITIDDDEQSEIWGEFRVARRAKKNHSFLKKQDSKIFFEGSFNGFFELKGKVNHQRNVEIFIEEKKKNIKKIIVKDVVKGVKGEHFVKSYVHIHPDVSLIDNKDNTIKIMGLSNEIATITIDNGNYYKIEPSYYCPDFGLKYQNQCIVIEKKGNMPIVSGYQIDIH